MLFIHLSIYPSIHATSIFWVLIMWKTHARNWRRLQFSSVSQLYLSLCDPMDCSAPGFPVHHQLLELAQTHVNLVSDGIQPSHLLSSPSPPAFNLSQHQGLSMGQFFASGDQSMCVEYAQVIVCGQGVGNSIFESQLKVINKISPSKKEISFS